MSFVAIELLLILACVGVTFGTPVWTLWLHGDHIRGPIVSEHGYDGDSHEWSVVRDPETGREYAVWMGASHVVGEYVEVVVHPTNPEHVWAPDEIRTTLGFMFLLYITPLAWPIARWYWFRGRVRDTS